MQKQARPHCGFFRLRLLIGFLLFGAACSIVTGIPLRAGLAFIRSETPAVSHPAGAGLTFAERVAYQQVIEEVYWRHRIWPKANPGPKPPLDAVISQEQIEKKVTDYLRKSQFVMDQRGSPTSASELQAEMDRMATHSKQPDVLRELFAALRNDPLIIAECLARPILAERLVSELRGLENGRDDSPNRPPYSAGDAARPAVAPYQASYRLPEIASLDCTDDAWTATSTTDAPDGRIDHTAVWTGSEMIVWGGFNSSSFVLNTGGRYNPATDSWIATSMINAPTARDFHTAVWTGTEIIIWGGYNGNDLNDGGRYNPVTDTWVAISTVNAPSPRESHTAVWTGGEMIVWGGFSEPDLWFNTGGRYSPTTDTWTATSTINAPEARWDHTVEWTGSEMIVWGGTNQTIYLNTGGKYNPIDDSWTPTSTANAPLGRVGHTAIWSGSEMMVWGGTDSTFNDCNTGGRYSPSTDSWMATSIGNAPSPRDSHAAVWTGSEMIVWGGIFCCPAIDFNTGGRYNPGIDSWTATSIANAPFAREEHTAVWTGSDMIVWGGYNYSHDLFFNTGGPILRAIGSTAKSDTYGNCYTGAKSYGNANFHSDGNGHLHAYTNTDSNRYSHSNTNADRDRNANADPYAHGHSNSHPGRYDQRGNERRKSFRYTQWLSQSAWVEHDGSFPVGHDNQLRPHHLYAD